MEASGDRPVILKGVTVPLTIREWEGEREILDHFRGDGRPLLRLADDAYCEKYGTRYVTVETPRSVLAIFAQIDAKTSEILQMPAPEFWLVGVDSWVFGVDWRTGTITCAIDVFVAFWMFHALPDGRVLIRHELGVIMVDATGRQLWYYDGHDVLIDWSVGSEALHLTFLEDTEVDVEMDTGVPISDPGPRAHWGKL